MRRPAARELGRPVATSVRSSPPRARQPGARAAAAPRAARRSPPRRRRGGRGEPVWGTHWKQQVAVAGGRPRTPSSAALVGAAERSRTSRPRRSPTGSTRSADARTGSGWCSPRPRSTQLTAVGEQIVLRHEITHLATAADTADITPRWLVEGFAEYVANLGTGQTGARRRRASCAPRSAAAGCPPRCRTTPRSPRPARRSRAPTSRRGWPAG